jgi:hypothetical protein
VVLETTVLPITPCSRAMLSEGIEPPMTAQGRLIYSQVQCHSASSAFRRSCFYSVVKKQKERVLPHTKRRNGPLPFVSFYLRTGLDFGSGNPLPLDQRCRREQSENVCSADLVAHMLFT